MKLKFEVDRVQKCANTFGTTVGADRRDGATYVYHHPDIQLALNVALITGRPLLVEGPSGCGKSTLALNAALSLGRKYYEFVVTNRSEAQDLLWTIDNLRRLNDANIPNRELFPDQAYLEPGVLWWSMNPDSATNRGPQHVLSLDQLAADPNRGCDSDNSVILIDEIDKADPDFPNGLLVPLGSLQFTIPGIQYTVRAVSTPLIIVTTNNERELPQAFLRRCVILRIPPPTAETLVEVATALELERPQHPTFLMQVAEAVMDIGGDTDITRGCSTAEYLDTVRACIELDIAPGDPEFEQLKQITLRKTSFER